MAPVVVSVTWRWLLSADCGLVNKAITGLGQQKVQFLKDPDVALRTILFLTGWRLIGFSTLVFAVAITQIDCNVVEAARMDGTSEWRLSLNIVIPSISPAILFVGLLTVPHGAQWSFVYINALNHGGQPGLTTKLSYLLYEYGFGNFAVGWSTAVGMLLFADFGIVAIGFLRLMQCHATYAG